VSDANAVAILIDQSSGSTMRIPAVCTVGRDPSSALRLSAGEVSWQHALLRWTGAAWELRDLGSRNGTWLDGRRLDSGQRVTVNAGAEVRFGARGPLFTVRDTLPPCICAIEVSGARVVVGAGDYLSLPDADAPELIVYRAERGWVLEHDEHARPIADGEIVVAGGSSFRVSIPEPAASTWGESEEPPDLDEIVLRFSVSRDEEHVALRVGTARGEIDLGARAHHYLLLTLARLRARDASDPKLQIAEHGWVDTEELSRMLAMDRSHLGVAIHRARQQLASAAIARSAGIVERRPSSGTLRLGVARFEIDGRELDRKEP
jgi:hypothetical protein